MDEKLESKLHDASARADRLGDDLKSKGKELLDKVDASAREFKAKHIDDIADDVGDFVKKHPGTLILASFAIGVAVGALVRGGRRDD
ncbi:MAG: hypothetical protein SGI90_01500 [Candidatus Eisenbacteria bacterium]|nr:hypothetical protein [Candidatus Eisenbacteria bacterium]